MTVEVKEHLGISIDTLRTSDRRKFEDFVIELRAATSLLSTPLKRKISKINIPGSHFFVYRLTDKMRVLFKVSEQSIVIQDIATHERLDRLFGKYLGGTQQ